MKSNEKEDGEKKPHVAKNFTSPDSNADEPVSKRSKTDVVLTDFISTDILQSQDQLRDEYASSKPYPHAVLRNMLDPDFLSEVQREIKDNSKVTFKESDLFRVYQSIDLANLQEDDEKLNTKMPHVMQLRRLLYSHPWRSFMERIAGLDPGTLSAQVDCACNCHAPGCHLLCHDDVIGTRKLSYILYMTESDWKAEEGGALELYDSRVVAVKASDEDEATNHRIPESIPCQSILPQFNHMAFFKVQPGYSFHAVQEVLGDRPRLSLQGWYHAAKPPENIEQATLQQLKNIEAKTDNSRHAYDTYPHQDLRQANEAVVEDANGYDKNKTEKIISEEDRKYLLQYLDPTYLQPEAIKEMRERFEEESSIQLRNVLNEAWSTTIKKACESIDNDTNRLSVTNPDFYKQGICDDWKLVGPPHMQRYLQYTGSENTDSIDESTSSTGALLHHIRINLLQSLPFRRYLNHVTSLDEATGYRGCTRRFRRGLDYTVAHFGLLTEQSVLDATLCFVAGCGQDAGIGIMAEDEGDCGEEGAQGPSKPKNLSASPCTEPDSADVAWQSGDVGGFECYIEAADDEDGKGETEPADEYNEDDETELLSVHASNNTLSLVYRDPGTMRFVKYLSYNAPSSRWDIAMEYEIPEDQEEEKER